MNSHLRTSAKAVGDADASTWLTFVPPGGVAPERDEVTVTYADIANSKRKGVEWLPFFSRLALMQTVRDLNRLGFTNIALARVPVEEAASVPTTDSCPFTETRRHRWRQT
ncbi:DUF6119 family protein [Microbacterium sp. 2RAF4]|uniref:DUF6119 family protein n=1 Tax=Microbacterium sp. 2RAF4 TaxID=3232999 RepID=UPI003F9CBE6C